MSDRLSLHHRRKPEWHIGNGEATIEMLCDDALLEIFDFYMIQTNHMQEWFILAHVCQRWRTIVFASPRRLNLRLHCTNKTPARAMLDSFPPASIIISGHVTSGSSESESGADNIVAALERRDRIRQITLKNPPLSVLDRFSEMMQESFPALTELEIGFDDQSVIVPLDSFVGAPHLQSIRLYGIRFPALSNILLSANNLIDLHLLMIPDSGFIPPAEMASCLSSLTRLEDFRMGFQPSVPFFDHRISPHPSLSRVDLPRLIRLWFKGYGDYLEDFVTRINTPLLRALEMEFEDIYLNGLPLREFIDRVENFQVFDQARIIFHGESVSVTFFQNRGEAEHTTLKFEIEVDELEDRFWHLDQALGSDPLPFSIPECLEVSVDPNFPLVDQDGYLSTHWLDLLGPFTAVKELYLCGEIALLIAPALNEPGAGQLFPALQSLFVEEIELTDDMREIAEPMAVFIALRNLVGLPVAVHGWNRGEVVEN